MAPQILFEDVNATFVSGRRYAITGPNGAGKSTVIMGNARLWEALQERETLYAKDSKADSHRNRTTVSFLA